MSENKKELTFGKLLAWSLRGGSTGVALMVMGYLTIFCTNTLGIPPLMVGTLMLASKLLDGVTDIFAGFIVDKTNTRIGRGRPYELCVIGLWAATLALFLCPASWSTVLKCVWIFIMYAFANSIFMTFLNANQTVYMVRSFSDPKHYVSLSTYGGIIPMVVVVIFNIVFPMLMGAIATSQGGWIMLIAAFAVPMTVIGLLRFIFVKETNQVDSQSAEKLSLKDVFTVLKNNPFIYIIALATLMMNLVTNMGVNVYYFTDIVGNVGLMGALSAVQVIAIPLMAIMPQFLKRTTTARIIRIGLLVMIAGYVLNYFAGSNFILLAIAAVLFGAGSMPISMLSGLMIIDCADYNESKGMFRLEGSLSAINGFATKLGAGLGAGLLGILLGLAGYDGTAAVQTASAINMVRMLYSLIPAALYILVYLAFHLYKLDKLMPEIRRTNEENRAKNRKDTENGTDVVSSEE
ncbi:MAG: MFS transporter [Clostridiales bacterium]|nr:MFS transporter [Clostridiales bacterium]